MSTSPSVPPRPGATLVGALPELERLIEQMSKALVPAMSRSHEARDDHGTGDGYAEAMWMLIKSLTFAVQAARAGHTGNAAAVHEALSEVDGCSRTAAGHTGTSARPPPARPSRPPWTPPLPRRDGPWATRRSTR